MKKSAIFLLACALLAGCAESHTVITYNVGALGKFSEDATAEVAAVLTTGRYALASLNELDSCNRRHGVFQLRELASATGAADFHFASAFPFAGGAYGNGVLSRKPIEARYCVSLPRFDGSEPRSMSVVETEDMVFASVHLDVAGHEARLLQAEMVNDWFSEHYTSCSKPVILCGDLNSTPDSETLSVLGRAWNVLSPTDRPTYASDHPEKCIDYVLSFKAARGVKVLEASVMEEAGLASDHFPVRVRFRPCKKGP